MISRYTVRKKSRALLVGVLRLLFLIGLCFIILYPLFKEVTSAFMGLSDVYNSSVKYIPTSLTLTNFYNAWDMLHYPVSLYKTLGTVVLVSLVHMVPSALVAYGFARYEFRMKNLLFALMLFFMVVPPDVLLVPYFLEFRQFQLIDTPWPFVLLGATFMGLKNGIYVFMLRQYFRGIPKELEEAAYVDGAGTMKTLVRVILPGASSMLLTVFLFSFVWQWLDATYTPVFCSNSELGAGADRYAGIPAQPHQSERCGESADDGEPGAQRRYCTCYFPAGDFVRLCAEVFCTRRYDWRSKGLI